MLATAALARACGNVPVISKFACSPWLLVCNVGLVSLYVPLPDDLPDIYCQGSRGGLLSLADINQASCKESWHRWRDDDAAELLMPSMCDPVSGKAVEWPACSGVVLFKLIL